MAAKVQTIKGPWKGLELNEARQTDQCDAISLNLTYHRGLKERRPGLQYKMLSAPNGILTTHTDNRGQVFFLLYYRNEPGYDEVKVGIWQGDTAGAYISVYNLTSNYGEKAPPQGDRVAGSWVRATLVVDGETRFVSILSTPNNTYFFDPLKSETELFILEPTTYATALNAGNIAYWFSPPKGYIAVEHQSRIYYAGFKPGSTVVLDRTVSVDQTIIPEQFIAPSRSEMQLPPYMIAYSDEYDPAGVQAHHFFAVEDLEKVTGLASFQENLAILTDKAVHVMTGGTDATFQIVKASSGVGCVAPRTVVEAAGVLYFMSHDGIYAFGGLGNPAVVKVSVPIDALFTGEYQSTFVPNGMRTTLSAAGWPFKIRRADMHWSHGFYDKQRNQLWFTVPVEGGFQGILHVTLVFDLVSSSWSVWTYPFPNQTAPVSGPGTWTSAKIAGHDRVFGVVDLNAAVASFVEVTQGYVDDYLFGTLVAVPFGWMTPRLSADGVMVTTWRNPRFKLLATGKTPAANPPQVGVSGERAAFDWGEAEREETAAGLTTHPESTTKSYFLGTMVLADPGCVLVPADVFTSTVEVFCKSESARVSCFDSGAAGRAPLVAVSSFSVERDDLVVRTK